MLSVYLTPTFLSLVLMSFPQEANLPLYTAGNDLMLSTNPSLSNEIFLSISHYFRHQKKPSAVQPFIIQLLLLLSGSIELNPGPPIKFPCGECKKSVKGNSIACDKCMTWYHKDCLHMGDQVFDSYTHNESLYWECTQCALQNISSTIFDSSISSNESDEAEFVNKKKYKSLRISVCNFQSI